jgi:hypothetical protein
LGSYEDYLAKKTAQLAEAKAALSREGNLSPSSGAARASASATDSSSRRTGPSNNQKNAWLKEREKIEAEISKLETEQARLASLMADPKTYEDKTRSLALAEEQRKVDQDLGAKMSRWEELCSLLEEAGL